jgi:hypothetical protein
MINITCSNSITTVQQDSNLEKNYFNIKGKFYTQGTIFYIFLDNDVYEIPLDKLEVNGSSQATMQDGINALAAILVNAGASGGGGGNLPVIDMDIDLSGGNYDLDGAGIYRITGFGDAFVFNDTGIIDGSRVILTNSNINSINQAELDTSGVSIKYQGTQVSVFAIPSGMTYEFIFDQSSTTWYCLNPQPVPIYNQDLGGLIDPYNINTIGYYQFLNTGGG